MISDAVNLASRVESLTKVYRVVILLSQYTYEHLAHPGRFDERDAALRRFPDPRGVLGPLYPDATPRRA